MRNIYMFAVFVNLHVMSQYPGEVYRFFFSKTEFHHENGRRFVDSPYFMSKHWYTNFSVLIFRVVDLLILFNSLK